MKRNKIIFFFPIILAGLWSVGCGNKQPQEQNNATTNIKDSDNFELGEQLHKSGNWQASNEALLKDYKEHDGKVSMTCYYLFLNYGMLGNSKKAERYLDDAFGRDIMVDELKESKANKKYKKVFTDKKLKPVIDAYLKIKPQASDP